MSDDGLQPGLSFTVQNTVTPEMSARHIGSGDVGVLSTPTMIAMMEGASTRMVQPHMEAGHTTVGYIVNIRHLAPTLIGGEVTVTSRLEEIDGRKLRFHVEAREGDKVVGEGEHVRVIIDTARFLESSND
ncbi:MAG TPA: thioesterase family protein [Candidatus Dormibacteraeota bacterium]|nr:thioesterase family protein [Candidatus Dormibacteraeota bacterium]